MVVLFSDFSNMVVLFSGFFFHMAVLVSVFLRDNCSKSFAYWAVFFHMVVLFQLFHKVVLFSIFDFLNGHSI